MEEKEKYVWSQDFNPECPYDEFDYIVDSETGKVLDDFNIRNLLNQQYRLIKELDKQLEIHNEYFKLFDCNSFEEFTDFVYQLLPMC